MINKETSIDFTKLLGKSTMYSTLTNNSQSTQQEPKIIASKVLIFDNVLSAAEQDALLCLTKHWENRFRSTETGDDNTRTRDTKKRDSLVLFDFEPFYSFFRLQLFKYAPSIKSEMGYEMDANKGFECQLTAHNDGHFYTAHTDYTANTGTRVSLRELTFVYYFHRQPKSFQGGELFLWDHYDTESDPLLQAPLGRSIEPLNNRVVFFLSKYWHEVRLISCPSQDFMDSRFTLNGWFHCC